EPAMDWPAYVRRHLPPTGLDPAREADIVEELAQQFEQTYEDGVGEGLTDAEAEHRAKGTVADWSVLARDIAEAERSKAARAARVIAAPLLAEPASQGRAGAITAALWHDARYGLRLLTRHKAFAVTTILTLALTIGATTAVFSLVNVVLLEPLPFEHPDRLVDLAESAPELGFDQIPFSPPDLVDFTGAQQSFSGIAAYRSARVELAGEPASERITVAKVSASLFDVLRVRPLHGRVFRADEDAPGHAVAVLSHALWSRRFGADPSVVGRTVLLDRVPYSVIGVLPPEAGFPLMGQRFNGTPAALFVPIAFTPAELAARGGMFNNSVVARLRDGVSLAAARAEATVLAGRIMASYSPELMAALGNVTLGITPTPLADEVAALSRPLLLVMLAAVLLLVLAGSANVGNLMLTLAAGRRRELAVRSAIGAGAGRLIRQLLAESLVIAGIGGALGLALAWALVAAAPAVLPAVTPRVDALAVDGRVLAFAAAITLLTALVFGIAPGLQAARSDARSALADQSRGSTGGGGRVRNTLVVLQCALATLLLVVAGLLGRSLYTLVSTDPGFETERALIVTTYLPAGGYRSGADVRRFYDEAVSRARAVPGIVDAGASMDQPMEPGERRALMPEGYDIGVAGAPVVVQSWITPGYLEAVGVPIVRGRAFADADRLDSVPVVLVNEAAAARFWPGEDPVGRRVRWSGESPWMRVVGVVGNTHALGLGQPVQPHTYTPIGQVADASLEENVVGVFRSPSVAVRTVGGGAAAGGLLRGAIQEIDPRLALTPPQTLGASVAGSLAPQRFGAIVVGAFAVAALLLAALGLHGVLAYGVRQQWREIGIRMALGATRAAVVGTVVGRGLTLTVVGVTVGLAGAYAATRALGSVLTGVEPTDPLTFAGMTVVLLGVTLAATWLPARTAVHVDPAAAIRDE
ncbi:MAG: ABC transporter permease, partial [Dehalococcoidia bacterium]